MIPQKLIDGFKVINPRHAGYVDVLNRHSVVGFEFQRDMDVICKWLDDAGVEYEKNNRFLIWIDTLKESIKKTLRKP